MFQMVKLKEDKHREF